MRKIFLLLIIVFLVYLSGAFGSAKKEDSAVEQTVITYLEGWNGGDWERMESLRHPDSTKKEFFADFTAEKGALRDSTSEKKIDILDVDENKACVKLASGSFSGYLFLAKWNGEWRIANLFSAQSGNPKKLERP